MQARMRYRFSFYYFVIVICWNAIIYVISFNMLKFVCPRIILYLTSQFNEKFLICTLLEALGLQVHGQQILHFGFDHVYLFLVCQIVFKVPEKLQASSLLNHHGIPRINVTISRTKIFHSYFILYYCTVIQVFLLFSMLIVLGSLH